MRRRLSRNAPTDPTGPFDVLLQLTLPVTLILAFVVVTEVRQFRSLYDQTVNTPSGVAIRQTEEAILSLQEQLLVKAAREVFQQQANELDLTRYSFSTPTPEQIADRAISPAFQKTTRTLYDLFGTGKAHKDFQALMRQRTIERFHKLATDEVDAHPGLGEHSREALLQISAVNEPKLDRAVSGEAADLYRIAAEPQFELIGRWVLSENATAASGEAIQKAWNDFVNASPDDRKLRSKRFRNLKVSVLQDILKRTDAPLLDEVLSDVL